MQEQARVNVRRHSALAAALALLFSGCGNGSFPNAPDPPDPLQPRTYAMGWAPAAPRLDIDSFGLTPERALGLSNFARMGIMDSELRRKPSYSEWERIFGRPLR